MSACHSRSRPPIVENMLKGAFYGVLACVWAQQASGQTARDMSDCGPSDAYVRPRNFHAAKPLAVDSSR